jgi:hypothetical protein
VRSVIIFRVREQCDSRLHAGKALRNLQRRGAPGCVRCYVRFGLGNFQKLRMFKNISATQDARPRCIGELAQIHLHRTARIRKSVARFTRSHRSRGRVASSGQKPGTNSVEHRDQHYADNKKIQDFDE